jgi:protein-S-isoprenylcysteine O-methyltransferase Ste14
MPLISRILFPACSCFGPLFMVLGLQSPNRSPVNNAMAFGGAFMLTVALLIMYFAMIKLLADPSKQA